MMKAFRFYLGNGSKYFPEWGNTMEGLAHEVLTKYGFNGYTVYRGRGLWEGEFEDVLIYDIFTHESFNLVKTVVNDLIEMTGETAILLTEYQAVSHFCPCPYDDDTLPNSMKF